MRNHEKRSEMFKYGSTSNRNSAGSSTLKRLNGGAGTFTFGVGPQVNSSTIARNRTDCSSSGTSRSSTGSGSSVILTNRFGSEQSSTRPVSSNGVQLDTSLTTINGVTNGLLHDLWPKAIFNCEKESHPFITREVMIKDIVKIGRAIVGSKVSLDTCLFDSRVLSRNHAILTYKDNKVYFLSINYMITNGY